MQNAELDYETTAELSVGDIHAFFMDHWKTIVASAVIVTTIGTAYVLLATPKYKATANIQMALVANSPVEPPIILVEKLKIPTYYNSDTFSECGLNDKQLPGEFLAKQLNPELNKNAPIVTISYESRSPEESQRCINAILLDIRKQQDEIAQPIIEAKRSLLTSLKMKLDSAERIKRHFAARAINFDFSDTKFSATTLLFSTLLAKESEITELRDQIINLKIALSEPQTREAYLVEPIYSPNMQVSPKRTVTILVSMIAGICIGVLLSLLSNLIRREKKIMISRLSQRPLQPAAQQLPA